MWGPRLRCIHIALPFGQVVYSDSNFDPQLSGNRAAIVTVANSLRARLASPHHSQRKPLGCLRGQRRVRVARPKGDGTAPIRDQRHHFGTRWLC